MLHTFNAREMINLQSETNYAFHTSVAEDEFPQVHDFYELSLITAGKMQLIVNQEVFLAEPGFLVLIQPGNSTGIDALGGSSETFFGKNKGRSLESKMKRWTVICLVVLAVFAVAFFILQLDGVWGL